MPRFLKFSPVFVASIGALLLAISLAFIIIRNYRAVMFDFASTPPAYLSRHLEQVGIPQLEPVSFKTRQGLRIAGWYVPSKNHAAVVVTHGTNSDRSSMLAETHILAGAGFGVLAIDWPGNGDSEGKVQWNRGEREALMAAIDWLGARSDVAPGRMGGLGFSMGGYVMAQVAATDKRLHAVILEAAPPDFAEYTRWAHRKWGIVSEFGAELGLRDSGMPTTELRPVDIVREIAPRELLVIGGNLDTVVPEFMTRELYRAAAPGASLWIINGAGHGGYVDAAPQEYPERISAFFIQGLLGNGMT